MIPEARGFCAGFPREDHGCEKSSSGVLSGLLAAIGRMFSRSKKDAPPEPSVEP